MAFIIPDNFRNRDDVPNAVARVGVALKNGLDDSATAWLEPPFDATGQKPHFVLLLPEHGLAVIEVLDVRAGKLLGPLRGKLRVERDGTEVTEDPLGRAKAYSDILRSRIEAEQRLSGMRFPVTAVAAFPSLGRSDADAKGLAGTELFGVAVFREELEEAMAGEEEGMLDRWFAKRMGVADPIEGDLVDLVRGLVQPATVIDAAGDAEQLAIFRPPEDDDVIRVMDRRQEALAKSMAEGHRVVRGVAGSGKTLVLVYRAKLFAKLYPEQRFFVTCYTRSLASQLRVLLEEYPNVDVTTLDAQITQAARDAKLALPSFDEDPSGERRAEIGVKALEKGALSRYRAVFIDEAQDFGTNKLIFARMLADTRFDDVLVVADAAQNIFRRKFSWKQAGINAQGRTRILRINYRNTREILELASEFLLNGGSLRADETPDVDDENAVIPPEAALRTGARPTLMLSSNGDAVRAMISAAKSMLGARAGPKKVAILYLGGRDGSDLDRALRVAGVEYFWATDPRSADNKNRIAETTAPVILSTVHSAKGMEFPGVVLSCTPRVDDQDSDELRRTIYVGMTRATERLAVFADASHPLAADLDNAAAVTGRLRVDRVDNDGSVQDQAARATRVAGRSGRRQSAAEADVV